MLPAISLDLTIEQQFQLRLQVGTMSVEQTKDLLLQASKLLMLKDNVIRSLVKKAV